MACLRMEEQVKLAVKMPSETNQYVANRCKYRNQTNNLNRIQEKDKKCKEPAEKKNNFKKNNTCYAHEIKDIK